MGRKLFAEALAQARQEAGLSREAVASAAELSVRGLVKWERGERLPGSEELAKLCRAIDVTCDKLLAAILAEDPSGSIPAGKSGRPRKVPTEVPTKNKRKPKK